MNDFDLRTLEFKRNLPWMLYHDPYTTDSQPINDKGHDFFDFLFIIASGWMFEFVVFRHMVSTYPTTILRCCNILEM